MRTVTRGLCAVAAVLMVSASNPAQDYRTILDSSESRTPQGARGSAGSDVVLACTYTPSGGVPQPEFDPTLGTGDVRIVGSYQYVGSTQDNNGVLDSGAISGTGGSWTQINVPDSPAAAKTRASTTRFSSTTTPRRARSPISRTSTTERRAPPDPP